MSQIEVILKQKVENLGAEADVIKVKRGYALNYLIPGGKAYEATKGNLNILRRLKRLEHSGKLTKLSLRQNLLIDSTNKD